MDWVKDILNQSGKWMEGEGPEADIIISSRVRLARNLEGLPFPAKANEEQSRRIMQIVEGAIKESQNPVLQDLVFISLPQLAELDRQVLMERHLISPQHLQRIEHKGVILRKDEAVSIMVNEEDHLRIQCLFPGFQLEKAWELCTQIDDALEEKLSYAYDERLGYLTCCPTNVGTGMRASVMMHLPALVLLGQVEKMFATIAQFGLVVRGLYGEGTQAAGNMFQISNQLTLGREETEIINMLKDVAQTVVDQERNARAALMRDSAAQLTDRVWRAYGILRYAHTVSSQEVLNLLSDVRLGADLGIIKGVNRQLLNELTVFTQSGYLQRMYGQQLDQLNRDVKRADLVREKLGTQ